MIIIINNNIIYIYIYMRYTYIFVIIIIIIIFKKKFLRENFLFNRKAVIADLKNNNITVDKHNKVLTMCQNESCISKSFYHNMTDPNITHLAGDKISSKLVLVSNNVPVSKFTILKVDHTIEDINFLTRRHNVNYPVVYKPIIGTWGNFIKTNINTVEELHKYINANKKIRNFYIEQQYYGENYRIFAIDDKVIDIIHRKFPQVIGDGINKLSTLITNNSNYRLANNHPILKPDYDFILKKYYYTYDTIIPKDEIIIVTDIVNYHRGSVACRVDINSVHPDNIEIFKKINNIFSIKYSGIDFLTKDISKSYKEGYGVIIEINTAPDDAIHYKAECGNDNKEYRRKYIKALFPELNEVKLN
jgi:hypothetical protein